MKLDLHGVKHEEVEKMLEDFIFLNEPPFRIITGNSIRMKEIVTEVLEKHGFTYSDFGPSIIAG